MTERPVTSGIIDLASRALGGSVMWCTDEFFADASHLLEPGEPVHDPSAFTPRGKAYDGWESRRRRSGDRDSAIIRLGVPGQIRAFFVNTAFFTGNAPTAVSVDGVAIDGHPSVEELLAAEWLPLLGRTPVDPDSQATLAVDEERRFTHVRLTMHPDGGVARLRVLGEAIPDPRFLLSTIDLVSIEVGGRVMTTSNEHYSPSSNVLRPGPARGMHEGWENARRRTPGHESLEIALGLPGTPEVLEINTSYFVGNAPAAVRVHGLRTGQQAESWIEILPETPVQPDTPHRWLLSRQEEIAALRIDAIPDGGIARVRLWGSISPETREGAKLRWIETRHR